MKRPEYVPARRRAEWPTTERADTIRDSPDGQLPEHVDPLWWVMLAGMLAVGLVVVALVVTVLCR